VRDLPRPGFETGRWRLGSTTLYPVFTAAAALDNNLFATATDAQSTVQFRLTPRIDARTERGRLVLETDLYADARLHSRFTSEDRITFGGGTAATYAGSRRTTISGGIRFDRGAEPRSDPETSTQLQSPALYNSLRADLGVGYRGARWGVSLNGGAQWTDYLTGGETDPDLAAQLDDRDLASYRLPVRLSWIASPRLSVFVEPYLNRRDARPARDRTGIDRDVTTYGVLTGVTLDIAERWTGSMGVGGFRANPDDPALESFSGLAVNGNVRWSPDPRTGVNLSAFRGDVATVRAGASGRIDTRLQLRLDQEIRHNLLANAGVGWRRTSYRDSDGSRLTSLGADAEVEYLISRTLSAFAGIDHETRRATNPLDRFNRTAVGFGIRLRS
jgi:hypothetical protein